LIFAILQLLADAESEKPRALAEELGAADSGGDEAARGVDCGRECFAAYGLRSLRSPWELSQGLSGP
jgi:hypothetical protein